MSNFREILQGRIVVVINPFPLSTSWKEDAVVALSTVLDSGHGSHTLGQLEQEVRS